jgi:hypothetical protein
LYFRDHVAVGGTDLIDTVAHSTSTYWNSSNTPTFASAKSYVPEIPWNDSYKRAYGTTTGWDLQPASEAPTHSA